MYIWNKNLIETSSSSAFNKKKNMELNTSKTIVDNQGISRNTSYQNCTESDLVGYNDCPTFMFSNTLKNKEKSSVSLNKKQAFRKTSIASFVPPQKIDTPMQLSNKKNKDEQDTDNNDISDKEDADEALTNEEILLMLKEKIESNEKNLNEKEFNFYKTKVLKQIDNFSDNDRYLKILSDLFLVNTNCNNTKLLVQNWVSKEPNVSSWLIPLSKII